MNIGIVIGLIKALAPGVDPEVIEQAVTDWLDDHPEATTTVQDGSITEAKLAQDVLADLGEIEELKEAIVPLTPSATSGDVGKFMKVKTVSGGKVTAYEFGSAGGGGSVDLFYVTPEDYGAVGDGETDDSQAVQDACDAGYAVYFASNKTYYLESPVTIDHDCHLFGGENTVIKMATPSGGTVDDGIIVAGTLKKTTTLTTDYLSYGTTANCNNKFTLSDMDGISVGDLMVIEATDQYYHYARSYYYLGTTLLITDIYDGHIYTADTMPFDIENTENVSVKIYSAPSVVVENLHFVSDLDSIGAYKYLLKLSQCKTSTIKNCTFSQMANGVLVKECSNIKFDGVSLAKSKYDNSLSGDGYGIFINGCTNTVLERIIATCAQHAVAISGNIVTMNTFVKNCNLTAECRSPGLDTHECTYNIVIEDSVLATAALNATCTLNRCKVFANRRADAGTATISIYGSHNADFAKVRISNTIFENTGITIQRSSGQDPIQSYHNVFGSIEIENCTGGTVNLNLEATSMCLSNTINKLTINNWQGCKEIYNQGSYGTIKSLIIKNSTFTEQQFINNHQTGQVAISNIGFLDISDIETQTHKMIVKRATRGECFNLPKNAPIGLSSNNQSAKYVVCGANITPDNALDLVVGSVTGNDGGTLSRTVASGDSIPSIAFDSSGNLVWTQGANTSKYAIYPVGLVYVKERSAVSISCKVVNSGNTDAEAFRPFIAIVDRKTGTLNKRTSGSSVTATAQGADLTYSYNVDAEKMVMAYLSCGTAVSGAETTFQNLKMNIAPITCAMSYGDEPYEAKRLTGDGTILSLQGVNNIMCSDLDFNVNIQADMMG